MLFKKNLSGVPSNQSEMAFSNCGKISKILSLQATFEWTRESEIARSQARLVWRVPNQFIPWDL